MSKKLLPRVVYQMCVHGALLAGSQARKLAGEVGVEPNDFDLLVPLERWQTIALLIPPSARPNKFGGWRFMTDHGDERVEVDVWPDSVYNYLANCKANDGERVCVVDFINNKVYSQAPLTVR